jgi:NADP-dependent 3-hydroxy acid dehydrogenase YdfG
VDKLRENYESVDVLINNAAAGLGDLAQAGQNKI